MESSLPGIKFSTSTSAVATSLCKISSPSGFLKLTVRDRLFLFAARKYADSGGRWEEAFGAVSERGAAGGFHDPVFDSVKTRGTITRMVLTSVIATVYLLYFYNVCTEVGKEHCRHWASKNACQVKNANAFEWWLDTCSSHI